MKYVFYKSVLVLGFLISFGLPATEQCLSSNGTTVNIKEIVIGRCHEFFKIKNCHLDKTLFDCVKIWEKFSTPIIGKKPCNVQMTDFDDFISEVDHEIPANKTLFWSGTFAIAQEIVHQFNYWSLESSLSGYLLDSLQFCSDENQNYFVESSCPLDCVYRKNPFWNAVSTKFSEKATGVVTVVLNGTRIQGALANYSTFFNHELPALSSNVVSMVRVILLHMPGQLKHETCKSPKSLKLLEKILEQKQIGYECNDDPAEIMALMCLKTPEAVECAYLKESLNSKSSTTIFNRFTFFSLFSLVLILI